MKAQISSLLLADEHSPHPGGARAARSCGAAQACARATRHANSAGFSLWDIDMLLWIRHLSPTAAAWR